jgi:hypothetical protein
MKNLSAIGGLLTAFLFSQVEVAAVTESSNGAIFEATVRVELGKDLGQTLGTLFEVLGEEGNVLFGAGFDDVHSTYIRDNNRIAVFYRKGKDPKPILRSLGKPFGPEENGVRLIVDGDNVLSFFRMGNTARILGLSPDDNWVPYGGLSAEESNRFCGLQYVGNKKMVFCPNKVLFEGKEIFESEISGLFYFVGGEFFFYQSDPHRLFVCPWSPDQGERITLEGAKEFEVDGYPFVFGNRKGETIVASNIGNVYVYKEGSLKQIRQSDGKSWQAYSILNYYGDLAIGHYPTGSLYTYNDNGLSLFNPPIPVPEGASASAREAQTLAIYCGDLYAGVWPWGELWRLDSDTKQWEFVHRVFQIPEVSEVSAPYVDEMTGKEDVMNYWGQRITSLVNRGDSLFIGTMNKQGSPFKPDQHDFLDAETVEQYGKTFRLTGDAQAAAQFEWKEETVFRFVCDRTHLRIYQDGKVLAETEESGSGLEGRTPGELRHGRGIYGNFAGTILEIEATP